MARLYDYAAGEYLRQSTFEEHNASVEAAKHDGGAGIIIVDGRRVWSDCGDCDDVIRCKACGAERPATATCPDCDHNEIDAYLQWAETQGIDVIGRGN
jgi:hypothetical protein